MKFGGIGVPELLIILAVALLIFGPKNLPKLGSALGKTVRNLRDGMGGDDKKDTAEIDEAKVDVEEVEEEPAQEPVKKTAPKSTAKKTSTAASAKKADPVA
jgi:sec-independent protein translocase protein TatA